MKRWKKLMAVTVAVVLAAVPVQAMAAGWEAEEQESFSGAWEVAELADTSGLAGGIMAQEAAEGSVELLSADIPASCSQQEWDVLAYTNKERLAAGLDPLTTFTRMQWAAGTRAIELHTLFDHIRPDGSMCYTVLNDKNISGWWTAAENIAAGYGSAASVVEGWMNSPGHRANILTKDLSHMGVGYYYTNSGYGAHWVQLFIGSCNFNSLSITGLEDGLVVERGTSLEDLGLACKLTCSHGNSYLPLDDAYCSGYDPKDTSGEPQTVTVNVLGRSTTFQITVKGAQVPGNTSLRVTGRTTSTVSVQWDRVSGAEGYTVWYQSEYDNGVSRKVFTGGNVTSWTHTNLQPGTKYFYTVRAWVDNGTGGTHDYVFGEQSPTQRGTTKPVAARIASVTASDGKIKVRLSKAADGAELYSMCYGNSADCFGEGDFRVGIRTQYTSRTLTPEFEPGVYYVAVKSYRDLGNNKKIYGDWSNVVRVPVRN